MGLVESLPVQRMRPTAYWPLYLGTMRDYADCEDLTVGSAPYWASKRGRDHACFAGGAYLTAGSADCLRLDYISVEAVVSLGRLEASAGGFPAIVDFTSSGGTGGYLLYWIKSANRLRFWAVGTATSIAQELAATERNTPLHLVGTYDGTKARLYINAAAQTDGIASTGPIQYTSGHELDLGRYFSAAHPLHGAVSMVRIWPEPLTQAEISTLYAYEQDRFTPRKQWPGGGLDVPSLSGAATEPKFLDSIQTSRVSFANETSGMLSNTGWRIDSGSWKVVEDAAGRYVECISDGILHRPNVEPYGTWDFRVKKAEGSTTDIFILQDTISVSSGDGYRLRIASNEQVSLMEYSTAYVFLSSIGYLDAQHTYDFRVTRATDGLFSVYVRGGRFGAWTLVDDSVGGTNPRVNNNNTASTYCVLGFDAGDRLYLDNQYAGVVAP